MIEVLERLPFAATTAFRHAIHTKAARQAKSERWRQVAQSTKMNLPL